MGLFCRKAIQVCLCLALTIGGGINGFASAVGDVTLAQAVRGAQLVFEGKVIASQVRIAANGDPFTYFTFQVIDVIQGVYPAATIELGYMGGVSASGVVMQVGDMHMPVMGEHGIYFVESLARQQVHPLYGWDQGHYIILSPSLGMPVRVVPATAPAGAVMMATPLLQFKQQVKALGGGK